MFRTPFDVEIYPEAQCFYGTNLQRGFRIFRGLFEMQCCPGQQFFSRTNLARLF